MFHARKDATNQMSDTAVLDHIDTDVDVETARPVSRTRYEDAASLRSAALSTPSVSPVQSTLTYAEQSAAHFDAGGRLSTSEVARAAGLRYRELVELRKRDDYLAEVRLVLQDALTASRAHGIATRAGRLSDIQRQRDLLAQIREERAAAADPRFAPRDPVRLRSLGVQNPDALIADFPSLGELYDPQNPLCSRVDVPSFYVPGASTGLLTRVQKQVGVGSNARIVDEWSLDSSLLSAESAALKRAAEETGQLREDPDGYTQKMYVAIDLSRF